MPSDFFSLFSEDLDLNPDFSSLFCKESVYDLLPRELQLYTSTLQGSTIMSQTSGGEAGPPSSSALATDAMSASLTMEGRRSALSSSSKKQTTSSDQTCSCSIDSEDVKSCRMVPEPVVTDGVSGNEVSCHCASELRGRSCQEGHLQMTPSKRHPVLNISPPPQDLFDDSRMSYQGDTTLDSEQSNSIWTDDSLSNFSNMSVVSYNDNTEVPRKSRKRTPRQRPGPKSGRKGEASMDVFDADSAKAPHFVLSQLGPESKTGPKGSSQDDLRSVRKGGILSMQYPPKSEGKELKIVVQPETQHRARYLTEGSRGSVKDRTQQGFPTVKLEGVNEPVVLQVFVGNDAGRVKPHGFYQACRVTGRNTTACSEVDFEGTTVIEVPMEPSTNMTLAVDCVGILKLRNADVEARIGVAGSKKKSTRARLVFRVNIPRPDGSVLTLQTPSSPILCTQPAGMPEILKKSLHSCSVKGGEELFIIGKNFLKDTKVLFQENASDESSWKAEAEIDMEYFHQNHLIVKVPQYPNQALTAPVCVGIYVVTNAGRSHDVQLFTYTPDSVKIDTTVKTEMPSPVKTCPFEEPMKREDVMPMEVTSNLQAPGVFKADELFPTQPSSDIAAGHLSASKTFSSSVPQPAGLPDKGQSPGFTNPEPLSTIQKQDISAGSFSVPVDTLLPPARQQFLLERLSLEAESSMAKQQQQHQQHIQHQQQLQQQQQQQQQQHVMENLQQQLFQSQVQMQCGMFQDAALTKSTEQQSPSQGVVPNHGAIFQQAQQNQQQQQQQQQVALFQQANEIISAQTNFLQQTPTHPSPPIYSNSLADAQAAQGVLFHSPSNTQEQAQTSMFPNPLAVLQSPEQRPPTPGLFCPQATLPPKLATSSPTQQQQLEFLSALQPTAPESQPVFPAQTLSTIQQNRPMDQQPAARPQTLTQPALQPSLFQNISQHSSANTSPPGQQQLPGGLLFCNSTLSSPDQNPGLLFNNQGQMPPLTSSSLVAQDQQNPSLLFSQASVLTVNQQNRAEPMALGNPGDPRQQVLYQEQQPMQLGTSTNIQQEQPVGLFVSQPMASLQAAQSAMFASPNGVRSLQTTAASPVQQPRTLFQPTVSATMSQPSRPQQSDLFLFGMQNECGQLINAEGNTLSDQIIAISQSGQNQRETDAHIQSLMCQSLSRPAPGPTSLGSSQNMEKIDDLLVSLQEPGTNITRSY
ncbi:nuclear factor of activated T-cells 5 isoform X2 [Synchiropus splendidus]|uniref:nuclear factor of activated T-cells 5 isoform X2 n=1 Tax=Synchiropus splendidus TaxID=270530 RepID=UPI00237EDF13|nr:nuclear factor of activated T-cells 5 isoform X2 [Synchiropus splendidus]